MVDVCLVQRMLGEHKESDPQNVIWIILGLITFAFSLSLWMITCNCLSKNDPVNGNYWYLSLNFEDWQISKIVVFGSNWHFPTKTLLFTFLAKLSLLNSQMWIFNTKMNFKVPKKSSENSFLNQTFFQKFGKCPKCNWIDFDTSSALQINCSNTYRVSLPCGFVAFDCQNEIM